MAIIDKADLYLELNLKECGKEVCIPTKAIVYSKKKYFLFHYIISGKGKFIISGKKYHLKKGTIFVIPPDFDCQYSPDIDDPWTYVWIGFNGTMVKNYLTKIGINYDNYIIKDNEKMNLKYYFESIYNEYISSSYLNIICLGLTYQLFGTIFKNIENTKKEIASSESYVKSALEFIKNNYQFDIKINDIANSIGVVPNYLSNVFHSQYGMSPKKYLTKIRMEKAIELLKEHNYKIKDVSIAVGYKNQLHFSNEFKKYFGVSPYNYKNENVLDDKVN